jgi:hypothetical protein
MGDGISQVLPVKRRYFLRPRSHNDTLLKQLLRAKHVEVRINLPIVEEPTVMRRHIFRAHTVNRINGHALELVEVRGDYLGSLL